MSKKTKKRMLDSKRILLALYTEIIAKIDYGFFSEQEKINFLMDAFKEVSGRLLLSWNFFEYADENYYYATPESTKKNNEKYACFFFKSMCIFVGAKAVFCTKRIKSLRYTSKRTIVKKILCIPDHKYSKYLEFSFLLYDLYDKARRMKKTAKDENVENVLSFLFDFVIILETYIFNL